MGVNSELGINDTMEFLPRTPSEKVKRPATGDPPAVTANVVPRAVADVMAAGLRGDFAAAEKLDAPLAALHRDLFIESNPIPTKWALARMGLMEEGIRLPLTPLSAGAQPAVLAAMRAAGVAVA